MDLAKLITWLNTYPVWFKWAIYVWVIGLAVLAVGLFIFHPPSDGLVGQEVQGGVAKKDLPPVTKEAQAKDGVLKRLLKETGGRLADSRAVFGKGMYAFDSVITTDDHIYIIEPRYVSRARFVDSMIQGPYYEKLFNGIGDLPVEIQSRLTVVVVVVVDEPMANWSNPARNKAVYECLPRHAKNQRFNLNFRGITFTEAVEGAWMVA